jgi:hypothetical protein
MFAPPYVGRKRRAEPHQSFSISTKKQSKHIILGPRTLG